MRRIKGTPHHAKAGNINNCFTNFCFSKYVAVNRCWYDHTSQVPQVHSSHVWWECCLCPSTPNLLQYRVTWPMGFWCSKEVLLQCSAHGTAPLGSQWVCWYWSCVPTQAPLINWRIYLWIIDRRYRHRVGTSQSWIFFIIRTSSSSTGHHISQSCRSIQTKDEVEFWQIFL